jgi:GAF domain-containing protein
MNAEPALDLGLAGAELTPGLRSCLAMPLIEGDAVVAVLALYRSQRDGFSEDDARLVELLAPRLAASLVEAVRVERGAQPSLKLVKSS